MEGFIDLLDGDLGKTLISNASQQLGQNEDKTASALTLARCCAGKLFSTCSKKGLPATGAIGFGTSLTTLANRVPKPPASMTTSNFILLLCRYKVLLW